MEQASRPRRSIDEESATGPILELLMTRPTFHRMTSRSVSPVSSRIDRLGVLVVAILAVLVVGLSVWLPTASARVTSASANQTAPAIITQTGASAGYWGTVSSGNISQLTMETIVPTVVCQASLPEAQIVGIDTHLVGTTSTGLGVVAGIDLNIICDMGSSTPRYAPLAYDCISGSCSTLMVFTFSVSPSNRFSYSISIGTESDNDNNATMTMKDLSTGNSGSATAHFNGALNMSSAAWFVAGPSYPCTKKSCVQALTEFTQKIAFDGCEVVASTSTLPTSSLSDLVKSTLVDSDSRIMAKPSDLKASGTEFTVTWKRST